MNSTDRAQLAAYGQRPHDPAAWLQTYTGRQFWPLRPRGEDIDLLDIAHALSNQCRFAGHTRSFYSVAEHSVYVSRIVPPEWAAVGLLHDASEAYLMDVPRPIKGHLGGYREMEEALMWTVCARFNLTGNPAAWAAVKYADNAMLAAERDQVMGIAPALWGALPPAADIAIAMLPPAEARALFLARAHELGVC